VWSLLLTIVSGQGDWATFLSQLGGRSRQRMVISGQLGRVDRFWEAIPITLLLGQ
jgi:hypothetical protein